MRDPAISAASYLGILLNLGLYGILAGQIITYSLSYNRDHSKTKALVYGLFLLNTLQSILLLRDGFITFAKGYGDVDGLLNSHLEWLSVPYITSIVSFIVQVFFAYRIYVAFERSYWISSVILMASAIQAIAGILAGTKDLQFRTYTLLYARAGVEIMIWHVAAAVCDLLIAASMGFYLFSRDDVFRTHSHVSRGIRLALETGTVTAIVTIANLILFFAAPRRIYFVVPSFISAKLYANTVLVVFNNRAQFVTGVCDTRDCVRQISALRFQKTVPALGDRTSHIEVRTL
ncbi:hypothetical protein HYPSUDRAFT_70804 [Hypholoma sublateritium FD-334 SS-4]|uniref:DUF6534 domain-containing protein n=1 Tax=Hypholoma sublateritium (strain FD-334 SS-4) TaxID=945553 RepID=A0A0D2KRT4_HYPSF|nr:hypothetical protein HYPSUDRAFT_70804 [Hypholoma sublateritium FD-334 SS-4]